jgi:hypothetical protein
MVKHHFYARTLESIEFIGTSSFSHMELWLTWFIRVVAFPPDCIAIVTRMYPGQHSACSELTCAVGDLDLVAGQGFLELYTRKIWA